MTAKEKRRARLVASCIRDVWSSLDSHLDHVYKYKNPESDKRFQKKCVVEYACLILKLTQLY